MLPRDKLFRNDLIKNPREIKNLAAAEEKLASFPKGTPEEDLHRVSILFDHILEIDMASVSLIEQEINEYGKNINYILWFIEYACRIRPKQSEALLELYSKFFKKAMHYPSDEFQYEYRKKLFEKGIFRESLVGEDKSVERNFFEGSIESALINDDIERFKRVTKIKGFNPKKRLRVVDQNPICYVLEDTTKFDEVILVSYMQIMAYYGALECFKYALQDGRFDTSNVAPYAVAGNKYEILEILDNKGVSFANLWMVAVKFHHTALADWILNNYNNDITTPFFATHWFNLRAVYFILRNVNDQYRTHEMIDPVFRKAVQQGYLGLTKYMLDVEGADIKYKDNKGRQALYYASDLANVDMCKYLIEERKVDIKTVSPRAMLLSCDRGNMEMLQYWIDRKFDVNCKIESGITPIHQAAFRGHLDMVKFLINNGANYKIKNDSGCTPLHYACDGNNLEVVKYFVEELGCTCREADGIGKTALHHAANYDALEVVKYFIEKGETNENLYFRKHRTPLHCAAAVGGLKVLKYFFEKLPQLSRKINRNDDLLENAIYNNQFETVKFLVENGANVRKLPPPFVMTCPYRDIAEYLMERMF